MAREIDIQPDEAAAIDGPWPGRTAPRQLPVDILLALGALSELPPICGGAPEDGADLASGPGPVSLSRRRPSSSRSGARPQPESTVSLVIKIKNNGPRTVVVSRTAG